MWNLETSRRHNADSARCVCWILRSITDPGSVDSAIRLAGDIPWFNPDSAQDPPFDLIVTIFEACFDSNNEVYPSMRDRAYFSARAILRINVRARAQSNEHALKYPIPALPSNSSQHTDPLLRHMIRMLELNSGGRSSLDFSEMVAYYYAHSLWMSSVFVELTRLGSNPTLYSYDSYFCAASANYQPVIANILLVWYMLLGGHVEGETFWLVDKSYVVSSLPPFIF